MNPEQIKPYDDTHAKGEQVEQMFDSIAPAYDFMNTAMTFGLCRVWRNKALKSLRSENPQIHTGRILDLACGTGDLTLQLASLMPQSTIIGADLSSGMLEIARKKLSKEDASLASRIEFMQADALHLPFPDAHFDAITIAYGVRNFEDLAAGYAEMRRVLKPGGRLYVIELCEPKNPMMRFGYKGYSRYLIPTLGRLVSKDSRAYSYLPESIAACPQRDRMAELMLSAGFNDAKYRVYFPGVCALYTAGK